MDLITILNIRARKCPKVTNGDGKITAIVQGDSSFEDRLQSVLASDHPDIDMQTEQLQAVMVHSGADQLDALAAVVTQLCMPDIHRASLITFLWIREHLTLTFTGILDSDQFGTIGESLYIEFENLFEGHNHFPHILAGRGGIECTLLKAAATQLRGNRGSRSLWGLEDACKEAFGSGYIESAVAGSLSCPQTDRTNALLFLGQQLHVGDYDGLRLVDAIVDAKPSAL